MAGYEDLILRNYEIQALLREKNTRIRELELKIDIAELEQRRASDESFRLRDVVATYAAQIRLLRGQLDTDATADTT